MDTPVSNSTENVQTPVETAPTTTTKGEIEHVLKDLHKFKSQAKELEEKLKAKETEDMKRSQKWQELAELKEKENSELKRTLESKDQMLLNDKKYSALKDAAMKAGLRKEAMEDLDLVSLDDIAVETTSTGKINLIGVDLMIETLKTKRPHWFGSNNPPSVNMNQPTIAQGSRLTTKDVFEAEKEARKTGDYAKYKQVLEQFRKQA